MEPQIQLIEITDDNHGRLGLTAGNVGGVMVRRPGATEEEVYSDYAAAMVAITDPLRVTPPPIGEGLMVGTGRSWLVQPDEDE